MNKKLKILISIILVFVLTNATKLIENGVSPKAIQIRLGHKNIEETMHIYPHCSGKMEDNAVEIANSIF